MGKKHTSLTFRNLILRGSVLRKQNIGQPRKWNYYHIEIESCSVMSNSLRPHGLYSPWNSLGQNTGISSLSLLQGIFPTQGLNPGLPHCRQTLNQLSHKGKKMPEVQKCFHKIFFPSPISGAKVALSAEGSQKLFMSPMHSSW